MDNCDGRVILKNVYVKPQNHIIIIPLTFYLFLSYQIFYYVYSILYMNKLFY